MRFNLKHEKTTLFPIDGQVVQVSNLSEELRNEIDTLDNMIQKKINLMLDLEVIELAIVLKSQQVTAFVQQYIKDAQEKQEAANAAQREVDAELGKVNDAKPVTKSKRK